MSSKRSTRNKRKNSHTSVHAEDSDIEHGHDSDGMSDDGLSDDSDIQNDNEHDDNDSTSDHAGNLHSINDTMRVNTVMDQNSMETSEQHNAPRDDPREHSDLPDDIRIVNDTLYIIYKDIRDDIRTGAQRIIEAKGVPIYCIKTLTRPYDTYNKDIDSNSHDHYSDHKHIHQHDNYNENDNDDNDNDTNNALDSGAPQQRQQGIGHNQDDSGNIASANSDPMLSSDVGGNTNPTGHAAQHYSSGERNYTSIYPIPLELPPEQGTHTVPHTRFEVPLDSDNLKPLDKSSQARSKQIQHSASVHTQQNAGNQQIQQKASSSQNTNKPPEQKTESSKQAQNNDKHNKNMILEFIDRHVPIVCTHVVKRQDVVNCLQLHRIEFSTEHIWMSINDVNSKSQRPTYNCLMNQPLFYNMNQQIILPCGDFANPVLGYGTAVNLCLDINTTYETRIVRLLDDINYRLLHNEDLLRNGGGDNIHTNTTSSSAQQPELKRRKVRPAASIGEMLDRLEEYHTLHKQYKSKNETCSRLGLSKGTINSYSAKVKAASDYGIDLSQFRALSYKDLKRIIRIGGIQQEAAQDEEITKTSSPQSQSRNTHNANKQNNTQSLQQQQNQNRHQPINQQQQHQLAQLQLQHQQSHPQPSPHYPTTMSISQPNVSVPTMATPYTTQQGYAAATLQPTTMYMQQINPYAQYTNPAYFQAALQQNPILAHQYYQQLQAAQQQQQQQYSLPQQQIKPQQ